MALRIKIKKPKVSLRPGQTSETIKVETELSEMREAVKEIASSPESARRFLISTGMYTRSGKLKFAFR